jgi:GNAT superfamily N-acetyltransferase
MPLPPADHDLIARAYGIAADFNARMRSAVAALPGNPGRVAVAHFGSVLATRCDLPGAPAWMQRLAPVRAADVPLLADALAWFGELRPEIDTAPLPDHDVLARELARHGAVQTEFTDMLRGPVSAAAPPCPAGVEVRHVGGDDAPLFARTLLAGHVESFYDHEADGLATLVGADDLRCHLACIDGEPAAAAMLLLAGDTAYLANASTLPGHRTRGCHSALLAARLRDAAEHGCDSCIALAAVASTSHRNMERAGLHTLATLAVWTFPATG